MYTPFWYFIFHLNTEKVYFDLSIHFVYMAFETEILVYLLQSKQPNIIIIIIVAATNHIELVASGVLEHRNDTRQ